MVFDRLLFCGDLFARKWSVVGSNSVYNSGFILAFSRILVFWDSRMCAFYCVLRVRSNGWVVLFWWPFSLFVEVCSVISGFVSLCRIRAFCGNVGRVVLGPS